MDFISHIRQKEFNTSEKKPLLSPLIGLIFFVFILFCTYLIVSIFGPARVKEEVLVDIPKGYSLRQTAQLLDNVHVINSPLALILTSRVRPVVIKSGTYQFAPGTYSISEVVNRLVRADYGDIYTSITLPEGSTREQMAEILKNSDLNIDTRVFMNLSEGKEGYLFPDTYFFLPTDSEEEIISRLEATFVQKTDVLKEEYQTVRSFEDIVIMASIIEKEATGDFQEMRTISGILWKRLDKGMALQVDAPFLYIQGKTSEQLSLEDLRRDGPYNTYTNTGLTPAPIANPGSDALRAALDPLESLYFFYLHDKKGNIHYGITHDDHVRNKNLYLN